MQSFFQGVIMGFCIAAPVGPIGLLCIRRSIMDGRLAGFISGLGAATADGLCGLIAVSGLSVVTHFLLNHRTSIQCFGGAFLIYLGISFIRAKPPAKDIQSTRRNSLSGAYASTFALTLSNPVTILSFIGIFAGLGIGAEHSGIVPASFVVTGVVLGSAAWWLLLSTMASWLGSKVSSSRLRLINVAAGALIAALGIWQLSALLRSA